MRCSRAIGRSVWLSHLCSEIFAASDGGLSQVCEFGLLADISQEWVGIDHWVRAIVISDGAPE